MGCTEHPGQPGIYPDKEGGDVAHEDDGRQSIAQEILLKNTCFLRRMIVPVEGQGGVTLSHMCPHCHRHPLEDCIWSSGHGQKQRNWWCTACGGQYNWRDPHRILVIQQDSTDLQEAKKCFEHTAPRGVCDRLINALKTPGQPAEGW